MNAGRSALTALVLAAPLLSGCSNTKGEQQEDQVALHSQASKAGQSPAPVSSADALKSVSKTAAATTVAGTAKAAAETSGAAKGGETAAAASDAQAVMAEPKPMSMASGGPPAFEAAHQEQMKKGEKAASTGMPSAISASAAMPGGMPAAGGKSSFGMRFQDNAGGSFGGARMHSVQAQAANPSSFGRSRSALMPADSHLAAVPHAVYNPNMYVADTYIGGNGEKDRLEKLIQAGVLVDGKRVKLEAFTHDYAQSFPIPDHTALNVTADTVQSKIIQSGAHTYLQIGLQAMKGELPRRPPLNLALVLDRSGSMRDEHKLEYAKSAAVKLVDSLTPNDTFSLVAFDQTANVLVPAQHVTNKAHIRSLIAALQPGGSTNIYDALTQAYQQIHKNVGTESVSRVILLSDGEVTAGVNDPQQFHRLAAGEVDKDVQTSAVGVGVEFNEDLMLSLARDGKGNYHFLKDGADTQQVFARELDELTHVVAKNVKLRIQLAPGVGLIRVLGAQTLDVQQTAQVKSEEKKIDLKVAEELGIAPNRQNTPDEPGIKMLIPAFYRGDSHVVMLEIKVPPQAQASTGGSVYSKFTGQQGTPGACKLADVSVKYKDLVTASNREAHASASVTYTPSKDDMIYSVNRNVKKNLLGFQTGEALTQAATSIERGNVAEAIQKVDERRTIVSVAAQQWHDADLERDGKLLDRYKAVLAQLNSNQRLAQGDAGQYLRRSLAYNGYQMTR